VYKERDYQTPLFVESDNNKRYNRFCAVYTREGRPRTIVKGNTIEAAVIQESLYGISKKIIEQRVLVSRPGKVLIEENGFAHGIKIGLIFAVLLGAFVLFDYVLIPKYPVTFLQAANISSNKPVDNYSGDAKIFQYKSITERVLIKIVPEKYEQFGTTIILIAAFFIFLIFGVVFETAGKRADRRRMKHLPQEALDFQYGFDSVESILSERVLTGREKTKSEMYDRLSAHGLAMEKSQFEKVYEDLLINDG